MLGHTGKDFLFRSIQKQRCSAGRRGMRVHYCVAAYSEGRACLRIEVGLKQL